MTECMCRRHAEKQVFYTHPVMETANHAPFLHERVCLVRGHCTHQLPRCQYEYLLSFAYIAGPLVASDSGCQVRIAVIVRSRAGEWLRRSIRKGLAFQTQRRSPCSKSCSRGCPPPTSNALLPLSRLATSWEPKLAPAGRRLRGRGRRGPG